MPHVGEFEKVSFGQFYAAMKDEFYKDSGANETKFKAAVSTAYENIILPSRATVGSAGYDFKSPIGFKMPVGATVKVPTEIRVKIGVGWWLGCLPRSGLGFKYRLQLNNTMGVIDSDYYDSDNEGHIFATGMPDIPVIIVSVFTQQTIIWSDYGQKPPKATMPDDTCNCRATAPDTCPGLLLNGAYLSVMVIISPGGYTGRSQSGRGCNQHWG